MTQAAAIRAWLVTQGPATARAIIAALEHAHHEATGEDIDLFRRVNGALADMKIRGLVTSEGRPAVYTVARDVISYRYATEDERLAARRASKRNSKRQRLANETPAQRDERIAKQREYGEAYRRRQGGATRAEYRVKVAPKPKPAPKPIDAALATVRRMKAAKVQPVVRKAKPTPAPVVRQIVPAQTVDEFLAAGGQIERLHPGACRDPLRVIGVAL